MKPFKKNYASPVTDVLTPALQASVLSTSVELPDATRETVRVW